MARFTYGAGSLPQWNGPHPFEHIHMRMRITVYRLVLIPPMKAGNIITNRGMLLIIVTGE